MLLCRQYIVPGGSGCKDTQIELYGPPVSSVPSGYSGRPARMHILSCYGPFSFKCFFASVSKLLRRANNKDSHIELSGPTVSMY